MYIFQRAKVPGPESADISEIDGSACCKGTATSDDSLTDKSDSKENTKTNDTDLVISATVSKDYKSGDTGLFNENTNSDDSKKLGNVGSEQISFSKRRDLDAPETATSTPNFNVSPSKNLWHKSFVFTTVIRRFSNDSKTLVYENGSAFNHDENETTLKNELVS